MQPVFMQEDEIVIEDDEDLHLQLRQLKFEQEVLKQQYLQMQLEKRQLANES